MAVEKLSEEIRKFFTDTRKLEQFARAKVAQRMASRMNPESPEVNR